MHTVLHLQIYFWLHSHPELLEVTFIFSLTTPTSAKHPPEFHNSGTGAPCKLSCCTVWSVNSDPRCVLSVCSSPHLPPAPILAALPSPTVCADPPSSSCVCARSSDPKLSFFDADQVGLSKSEQDGMESTLFTELGCLVQNKETRPGCSSNFSELCLSLERSLKTQPN